MQTVQTVAVNKDRPTAQRHYQIVILTPSVK